MSSLWTETERYFRMNCWICVFNVNLNCNQFSLREPAPSERCFVDFPVPCTAFIFLSIDGVCLRKGGEKKKFEFEIIINQTWMLKSGNGDDNEPLVIIQKRQSYWLLGSSDWLGGDQSTGLIVIRVYLWTRNS